MREGERGGREKESMCTYSHVWYPHHPPTTVHEEEGSGYSAVTFFLPDIEHESLNVLWRQQDHSMRAHTFPDARIFKHARKFSSLLCEQLM